MSKLGTQFIELVTTPQPLPHIPEQNGISERHHRHLVEMGLTLLHDASLPLSYWPHAFQTAVYLIHRQSTPMLNHKSPYVGLLRQPPNYLKFKNIYIYIGSLCFPLTRPYNTHKLQPKATPCLFVGYSQTQNAYKCIYLTTNKTYLSQHVLFDETQSPIKTHTAEKECPSSPMIAPPISMLPRRNRYQCCRIVPPFSHHLQ